MNRRSRCRNKLSHEDAADQVEQQAQDDAHQDHGRDRKVEAEVLPFDPDISRQIADPAQSVTKERKDQTGEQNQCADSDQQPSDLHLNVSMSASPNQPLATLLPVGSLLITSSAGCGSPIT